MDANLICIGIPSHHIGRVRRFLLTRVFGSHYVCRCGAFVSRRFVAEHERWHQVCREFFAPPTAEEMATCRAQTGKR